MILYMCDRMEKSSQSFHRIPCLVSSFLLRLRMYVSAGVFLAVRIDPSPLVCLVGVCCSAYFYHTFHGNGDQDSIRTFGICVYHQFEYFFCCVSRFCYFWLACTQAYQFRYCLYSKAMRTQFLSLVEFEWKCFQSAWRVWFLPMSCSYTKRLSNWNQFLNTVHGS